MGCDVCTVYPPLQESAVAKHFVALSTNEVCACSPHPGRGGAGAELVRN